MYIHTAGCAHEGACPRAVSTTGAYIIYILVLDQELKILAEVQTLNSF